MQNVVINGLKRIKKVTEEKKPNKSEEKKPAKPEENKTSKGKWHGGKGSGRRSRKGDQEKYADAWEKIWGKTHEGSNGTDRKPPSGT